MLNLKRICSNGKTFILQDKYPPDGRLIGFLFEPLAAPFDQITLAEEELLASKVFLMSISDRPRGGNFVPTGIFVNVLTDKIFFSRFQRFS